MALRDNTVLSGIESATRTFVGASSTPISAKGLLKRGQGYWGICFGQDESINKLFLPFLHMEGHIPTCCTQVICTESPGLAS